MSNPFAAALTADPLFRLRLEGRLLNAIGVAALAFAAMVFARLSLPPGPCVIAAIAVAAAFFVVGNLLARTADKFAATTAQSVAYAAYVVWGFAAFDAWTRLGGPAALPYLLAESAVLVALALACRHRSLHLVGVACAAASLALFGSQWHDWSYVMVASVVAATYTLSILYGRINTHGGLAAVRGSGKFAVSVKEAWYLERAFGVAGYATLIGGTYLLGVAPFNTITMAVEALALIIFGFATDKVGHRFSGVCAIFLACAKLWILDLSGAGAGVRTAVGFAVFGVCSITAGIFYLVEYVWKSKPRS
jgi:hypothetical protein